jgi:2'-5' RNA ligase
MSGEPATAAPAARVRLFYAFWPDEAIRARVSAAAAVVADGMRMVPRANYHVTVAFIGAVSRSKIEVLRQIGRGQRAPRLVLRFDAYEYWPKPEVLVAAAHDIPRPLTDLWQTLHRDLAAAEFVLTPKSLRPHVTLARHIAQAPALPALLPFAWHATELCLVRTDTAGTDTAGTGSLYTVVDSWPLLDK